MQQELDALEAKVHGNQHFCQYVRNLLVWNEFTKHNPNLDGTLDRYKACLVANGYHQVIGIDYFDSFFLLQNLLLSDCFMQ